MVDFEQASSALAGLPVAAAVAVILAALFLYFAPTVIAVVRHPAWRKVAMMNLAAAWTWLGCPSADPQNPREPGGRYAVPGARKPRVREPTVDSAGDGNTLP